MSDDEFWCEDDDYEMKSSIESTTPPQSPAGPKNFQILPFTAIQAEQSKRVQAVSDLTGIGPEQSWRVLFQNRWEVSRVNEKWFSDSVDLGVLPLERGEWQTLPSNEMKIQCPICFEVPGTFLLACCEDQTHAVCETCWANFVSLSVAQGREALLLKCPGGVKCRYAPIQLVEQIINGTCLLARYRFFLTGSFVENGTDMKWCPNASCENAVRLLSSDTTVTCSCNFIWCFSCRGEGHEPVGCQAAQDWEAKNESESSNVQWILINTKQCPKCARPIEKNQGCNHMTCIACQHHFCWICGKNWTNHNDAYSCNKPVLEFRATAEAKTDLERYVFYFERFQGHEKAKKIAEKQIQGLKIKMQVMHDWLGMSIVDCGFLEEAMKQVIECRRILKWTYVFGFYEEEVESRKTSSDGGVSRSARLGSRPVSGRAATVSSPDREATLFSYLQKNLEQYTDRLHEFVEKDLDACLGLEQSLAEELNVACAEASGTVEEDTKGKKTSLKRKPNAPMPLADIVAKLPAVKGEVSGFDLPIMPEFVAFRSNVVNYTSVLSKFRSQILSDLHADK